MYNKFKEFNDGNVKHVDFVKTQREIENEMEKIEQNMDK